MQAARQPSADHLRRIDFDPVTRVAGGLALRTVVDFERSEVVEASALATLFRGYEVVLEGRDPRDAIFVSSRACGVCGGAHAIASALACEMAFGVAPPATGIVARNILSAIENLCDLQTNLFQRAGPDYCEPIVRQTNPELWTRAHETQAAGFQTHGYRWVSDIMTAMTPFSGGLYREALKMARVAREAYVLIGGKYPHPQTIVPGGISSTIDATDQNLTLLRVTKFFDYSRRVAAVWDDLADFFYTADPRFADVGAGPRNFLDLGQWDDPFAYDGTYENAPAWGERRWSTPGVVVDGHLRTTDLHRIDNGVEEFVAHSFYEDWTAAGQSGFSEDPAGNRVSAQHPWNKQTLPQPGGPNLNGKYSWSTAPRWDRLAMETGASARLWITALAAKPSDSRFIESTGHSLRMNVPQAELPKAVIEWHVPERWNALERNRARAYSLVHSTLVAYENVLIGLDLTRKGGPDAHIFASYDIPKGFSVGAGFWGGARGAISHHMAIDGRVIRNYQILAGSTFTASPADASGTPGPIEAAVLGTPLLSTERPERCLDVLRTIRSFDPCMACATH